MKYYLIAGEASGDLHGSNLMKELQVVDQNAEFRYFGGDLMKEVGGQLVKHYREMAFLNVILNLKTIKRNMNFCKKDLLEFKPDVLVLIDYPGFNLRIAEFAKKHNIKVYYYIAPKVWAWKEYRVKKLKACVDEMFVIFPFETGYFKKFNIDVHYVGNPLLDSIADFKTKSLPQKEFFKMNNLDDRKLVTLMAGSRVQEIKGTLPIMTKVAESFPDYQFVIAGVNSIDKKLYEKYISDSPVKLVFDQTYDLLNHSYTALVASGTAALEAALFNVPQTVIYKVEGGAVVDFVMRNYVIKTIGVSLPNIIMDELIVNEYIQVQMTVENVKVEMEKLLLDETYRKKIRRRP